MCPKITCIASAEPAEPVPRAKPSPWCRVTKADCYATSSGSYAAVFPFCPPRSSRSSNLRRNRHQAAIVVRGIGHKATERTETPEATARRRAKAARARTTAAATRVERRPAAARAREASASSSAVVSARTVWEPDLADSLRNQNPSSDASGRTPRWPVSIRACCRSRSACLRIRRHTRVRAASAGQCRR